MKTTLRLLFGMSALALLVAAAPAMAADVDVDGENNTTGADSENKNEYDVDNKNKSELDNDGDVENKAKADVNTGDNDQKKNTSGGDLDTGGVDASTDWESILNEGAGLAGMDGDLDVDGDFLNELTGAYSKNRNELDVENKNKVDIDNVADVLNKLRLWANTGDNDQRKNTEAGSIGTGDVDVDSAITNEANNDAYYAGAGNGSTSVDVTGENNTTGADSRNKNDFDIENKNKVEIDNDADFDNKIKVDANTGNNTQSKNTTAGDIDTGSIDVVTDIFNSANNGSGAAGAGGADLDVTGDFVNDTTGYDSKNKNTLDVENTNKVDIENDADIDNKLKVDANTGDNDQRKNTTGGDIDTGDVSIDFSTTNEVNNN